jgi:hypothetical protein
MGSDYHQMHLQEKKDFAEQIIKERAKYIEDTLQYMGLNKKIAAHTVIEDKCPKELLKKVASIIENDREMIAAPMGLRIHTDNRFHETPEPYNLWFCRLLVKYENN